MEEAQEEAISMAKMTVLDQTIYLYSLSDDDYISLTDIARHKNEKRSDDLVRSWLRNRNTIEFLGIWETLNNVNFNSVEFDGIRIQAGLNSFALTPKQWVNSTGAIGLSSKAGRYGGTYAHKDIAFEFASWINPVFKLYLIKEFQRLKEIESNEHNIEWNVRRIVSKANAQLHMDAVKHHIIPKSSLPIERQGIEYANESDLLNIAVFGCTAKQWRKENPELHLSKLNMRDVASINELTVLSNLESANSMLIKQNMSKTDRLLYLTQTAEDQISVMNRHHPIRAIKKYNEEVYLDSKGVDNES